MNKEYFDGQIFRDDNFAENALPKGEYENCTFDSCIFAHADLSKTIFADCKFEHCDLSMAALHGTAFREICFKYCKLLGLRFEDCNPFSLTFRFENCLLNFASFYQLKLPGTTFSDCKLTETTFVGTDLTRAVFKNCDLLHAVFEAAKLEEADFRTAFNFSIDPENNRIYKARFSAQNVAGLLEKYQLNIE